MPAVAVEIVVGFHVPVTPLFDVLGKAAGVAPTQYAPKAVKVGVMVAVTVTVIVAVVAHVLPVGVKV